jgi:glycosyltransferase involved in cell wall biosynthesis
MAGWRGIGALDIEAIHAEAWMNLAVLAAGSAIHTIRWVNEMATRGHRVSLITMHRATEPLVDGVKTYPLSIGPPAGYFLNTPQLRCILRRLQPDLLHAHYASGYGTLGRLSGFHPWILSVWGMDVYGFPGHSPVHYWLIRGNLRAADWICSTSEVMALRTRSLCSDIDNLSVTPFGIDTQMFRPSIDGQEADTITVGTVKTLAPKYGVDILIRAFGEVLKTLEISSPSLAQKLRLLVVGGGPEQSKLEDLAARLGLAERATFVGRVPHSRVPSYLNLLDVYVAASREDSESFGVAVLEASACGIPVVVSDAGGLPEVVRHGVTGIVVKRENVPELAKAILRLIEDQSLCQQLGNAGRKHVVRNYNWADSATLMERAYEQVLEARTANSG